MTIARFSKMHGLGNDFIVLNALHHCFDWQKEKIQALANRFTGIGFDQLLIVEKSPDAEHDFAYRIFNADGSEVEHCGNGARCFGKYLQDHGLNALKNPVRVKIKRGSIKIAAVGELFQVEMGIPDFSPFTAQQEDVLFQRIEVNGESYEMGIVSMGNPHAVCVVGDLDNAPVVPVGKALQNHALFPERVNVGFMRIYNAQEIALRVFERGVGETKACGTGACAAAAVGIARGILQNPVTVHLSCGRLVIHWAGVGEMLSMTGPATTVFHGELVSDWK